MGMIKGAIAAALTAAGLFTAPQAQAGELEYLQMLNYRGATIYNTAMALRTGYMICDRLNYQDGTAVISWMVVNVYQYTPYDMTIGQANVWMMTAVEQLCPWHDHRGEY